jgi:hypothetical protein
MLRSIKQQLRHGGPWILLGVSLLIAQVGAALYQAHDMQIPGPVFAVNYVVLLTALGVWLERDNRQYRALLVWDLGFFLYLAWVIVVPYYLIKTRGFKRGLVIVAAWVSAYIVAYFVGLVIFI